MSPSRRTLPLVDTLPHVTPAGTRPLPGLGPEFPGPPRWHRYEVCITVTRGPAEPPLCLPPGVNGAWSAERAVYWVIADVEHQGLAVAAALAAVGEAAGWDAEVTVRALA